MTTIFCRNGDCVYQLEGKCDADIVKMCLDTDGNNVCETYKMFQVGCACLEEDPEFFEEE